MAVSLGWQGGWGLTCPRPASFRSSLFPPSTHPTPLPLPLPPAEASSCSSSASAFGGAQFWGAVRAAGVEGEVRALLGEAKSAVRRKGGVPLLVELELKLARLLAGLHVRISLSLSQGVLWAGFCGDLGYLWVRV